MRITEEERKDKLATLYEMIYDLATCCIDREDIEDTVKEALDEQEETERIDNERRQDNAS